jgi:NCS1 nucleoside transporter family
LGVLGPEFGLTLGDSCAAIVVGTFLGALCTAYTGTLGPKTGLRAIATCRYSFGFWGAKLCSVLNVVIGGGFAVVNVVITGQMLSAVSDFTMTVAVGCVIVAVISYVISVFGFAIIHTFEKYSWIISFTLLLVLIGQAAPHVNPSAPGYGSGLAYAGSWLSFMAINFSNASGWCSMAADYYCNYPASTKSWKVFCLTLAGVILPTTFCIIVGACIGNATLLNAYPPYHTAYEDHGLGGLLREIYHPLGWSKFCLVILTFSVLGNNIAINYSSGLSLQLLGHYFHAVPRFIWSFLVALVVAILAIVGKDHLSTIVSNFVSLLGYWTISWTFILLIEDQWFRKRSGEGYNLEIWDDPEKLPWGVAAVFSLLAGYLAGGLPGMAQVWVSHHLIQASRKY